MEKEKEYFIRTKLYSDKNEIFPTKIKGRQNKYSNNNIFVDHRVNIASLKPLMSRKDIPFFASTDERASLLRKM